LKNLVERLVFIIFFKGNVLYKKRTQLEVCVMDYIIEIHINNHNKTDYQVRVFKTESFNRYVERIKNGESFIVYDIFGNRGGVTLPKLYSNFKILREDEDNFVFTMTIFTTRGNFERTVYLSKVYSEKD
jgi:hypothetical protein